MKFREGLLTPLLNLLEHVSDGAAVEEDVLLAPHLAVVDHHHQHHQLRQDARRGVQDGLGDSCQRNFAKKDNTGKTFSLFNNEIRQKTKFREGSECNHFT